MRGGLLLFLGYGGAGVVVGIVAGSERREIGVVVVAALARGGGGLL